MTVRSAYFEHVVTVIFLSVLLLAMMAMIAFGHSWYPQDCCGGPGRTDCHPVACDELIETKDGVQWKDLTFKGGQIRPTQDNDCHVCDHTYGPEHKPPHHGYCVFVRPSS